MSIKRIKTLQSKLKMSDAEYRALLMRVAGVRSSTQLSEEGDRAVCDALAAIDRDRSKDAPKTPQERKIWAAWLGNDGQPGLTSYLPSQQRTPRYLAGIIKHCGPVAWYGATVRFNGFTIPQAKKAIEIIKDKIKTAQEKSGDVPF